MPTIGFLHTAAAHRPTFDTLVAAADPDAETVVVVDESLLTDARERGPGDPAVRAGIRAALDTLAAGGADVIVCTCSTIAGEAEALGAGDPVPVVRIDRPMAEAAVACGPRIAVVAALECTIAPTTELLDAIAAARGVAVTLTPFLRADAWARFEAGDLDGYLDAIADAAQTAAVDHDVVVLAQASMAGALARVHAAVPVLASPAAAVAFALDRAGA
jgi:hypothetical protein